MAFSIEFQAAHLRLCILIAEPGIPQTDAAFDMCKYPQDPATLFVRIADDDLSLQTAMKDDFLSIGFESEDGYVWTHREGGLAVTTKSERNFLKMLELAVAEFFDLPDSERTPITLDLEYLMLEAVRWMRRHRGVAAQRSSHYNEHAVAGSLRAAQGSTVYEEEAITEPLRTWSLEYDEFKAFLRAMGRLYYHIHGSDSTLVRLREHHPDGPQPYEQDLKSPAGRYQGNMGRTTRREGGMHFEYKVDSLIHEYRWMLLPKVRNFRTNVNTP